MPAIDKLAQKVTARRAELEAELERLSPYDKPAKKTQAAARPQRPGRATKSGTDRQSGVRRRAQLARSDDPGIEVGNFDWLCCSQRGRWDIQSSGNRVRG